MLHLTFQNTQDIKELQGAVNDLAAMLGAIRILMTSAAGTPGNPGLYSGTGNPEGSQVAVVGSYYWNTTTKIIWSKDSGSGSTGWVA